MQLVSAWLREDMYVVVAVVYTGVLYIMMILQEPRSIQRQG
jgi:hypothetical protein